MGPRGGARCEHLTSTSDRGAGQPRFVSRGGAGGARGGAPRRTAEKRRPRLLGVGACSQPGTRQTPQTFHRLYRVFGWAQAISEEASQGLASACRSRPQGANCGNKKRAARCLEAKRAVQGVSVAKSSSEIFLSQAVKGPYFDDEGVQHYFCECCKTAKPQADFGSGVDTACSDCLRADVFGSRREVARYLDRLRRAKGCTTCNRTGLGLFFVNARGLLLSTQKRSRAELDSILALYKVYCTRHRPHRDLKLKQRQAYRTKMADFLDELKHARGCLVCGSRVAGELYFVHKVRGPSNKPLSEMKNSKGKKALLLEADKCHVLCRLHYYDFRRGELVL